MLRRSILALVLISSQAAAITREEVMARAQSWVDAGVPYCGGSKGGTDYICGGTCNRPSYPGHPDWDAYRSDCSGFVSYSWALPPPGRVTGGFAPFNGDVSFTIDGNDLQPGDALNNNHHVALFAGWTNQGAGKALLMEELNCDKVAMAHEVTLNVSGSSVYSTWHSDGFTAVRYASIQTAPPNHPPIGSLDAADCAGISGWSQDPDAPDQAIPVHLYVNGPAGSPAATSFALTAANPRDDLCGAIGSCNHGFWTPTPLSLQDGLPHEIHAYGIDTAGGNNPELGAKTFSCSAILPAGVRRHIVSPDSMTAWNFSTFWQMLTVDDSKLLASAEGPALPEAPTLIQADDGTPEVWLVDGDARRHVPSPEVAAAWKLDLGQVQQRSAAEVYGLLLGAPLRPAPFLLKGSGPAVYLVDDPPPAPDPGDGEAAGAAGAAQGDSGGSGPGGSGGSTSSSGTITQGGAAATPSPGSGAGAGGAKPKNSNAQVSIRDEANGEQEGGCSVSERRGGGARVAGLAGVLRLAPQEEAHSLKTL